MKERGLGAQPGQYLTFQLQDELFGLSIETVREINRVGDITPIPKAPDYIRGVMNLRGKIIPVVSLRARFHMEKQEDTRDTCIVVIESEIGQVGIVVDAVREVVTLGASHLEPAPHLGQSLAQQFVIGMGKLENRVIILLDCVRAFSPNQLSEIAEGGSLDLSSKTSPEPTSGTQAA